MNRSSETDPVRTGRIIVDGKGMIGDPILEVDRVLLQVERGQGLGRDRPIRVVREMERLLRPVTDLVADSHAAQPEVVASFDLDRDLGDGRHAQRLIRLDESQGRLEVANDLDP